MGIGTAWDIALDWVTEGSKVVHGTMQVMQVVNGAIGERKDA